MPELSAPLRVTWNVPSDPALAKLVWDRIIEARVLFLEAEMRADGVTPLAAALPPRASTLIRLTVLADPEVLEEFGKRCPEAAKMDATALFAGHDGETLRPLAGLFRSLSLGLWSTAEGVLDLERALSAIRSSLAWSVSFLNPHAPAMPLTEDERAKTALVWKEKAGSDAPSAFVHDLFLSEAMGLNPLKSYGGCAAGDTFAHIGEDGVLYACRTLPVALGDLKTDSLKDIWRQTARRELRAKLRALPLSCNPCKRAEVCKGGCPGLAVGDGRDGSCPGPVL